MIRPNTTIRRSGQWQRYGFLALAMILMAVGIHILVLVLSPKLPLPQIGQSTIDLNTKDDAEDDHGGESLPDGLYAVGLRRSSTIAGPSANVNVVGLQ